MSLIIQIQQSQNEWIRKLMVCMVVFWSHLSVRKRGSCISLCYTFCVLQAVTAAPAVKERPPPCRPASVSNSSVCPLKTPSSLEKHFHYWSPACSSAVNSFVWPHTNTWIISTPILARFFLNLCVCVWCKHHNLKLKFSCPWLVYDLWLLWLHFHVIMTF